MLSLSLSPTAKSDHIKRLQLYIFFQTETLLSLGVSICLNVISISTFEKNMSRLSRYSRQFKIHVLTVSITLKSWYISIFVDVLISISISTVWKRTSRQIEKSRSRLHFDLDISIVETNFLKVSRFSRLSRLTLCQCRDRDSRWRSRRDKSRPPGLSFTR